MKLRSRVNPLSGTSTSVMVVQDVEAVLRFGIVECAVTIDKGAHVKRMFSSAKLPQTARKYTKHCSANLSQDPGGSCTKRAVTMDRGAKQRIVHKKGSIWNILGVSSCLWLENEGTLFQTKVHDVVTCHMIPRTCSIVERAQCSRTLHNPQLHACCTAASRALPCERWDVVRG